MFKNPIEDLKIQDDKLNHIYRAVVEDNDDPLKAGRVRVRIHGLHSSKIIKSEIEGIPVNELPFAEPAFPINEGSISGFGNWSVPVQGSHVFVFFENGNVNRPIYFASVPGIPEEQSSYSNNNRNISKTDGFKDPDEQYPIKSLLGEPDVNRLAREETSGTIVETKDNNRDTGVSIAGGGTWNEPSSTYNTQYPHNYVISTHGGIVIELDSTPNSKRISINHPSNSFIEIDNDGNMIVKNDAEKYEIVMEGKNIHIKEQRNLTIDGNSNKKIGGNEEIEITGSKNEDIGSSKTSTIGGDKTENITGSKSETIGSSKTENITGSKSETIGSNLTVTVTGNISITASGVATVQATTVNLTGAVNLATQGSLQAILNAAAASVFNSHTHNENGDGGGVTDPPNQSMGASSLTTNTKAS